ncbi:MAG TPA: DUF4142 domain-containing protein [Allosphingosinicella sp.]|nr:DUF4142 domain-containing protein [Allosphingosinicella sp.]
MMRVMLLAAAASLSLGACTYGDTFGGLMVDPMPEERVAYVDLAAASDLFEIQSSQLALARSQNPAIREFAQMMVTHHNQTTEQLNASARAAGITPAPRLAPGQVQMMNRLQQTQPGSFDRLYMEQQVRAHELALGLHSNYARAGDTPALRATAAAAVPIVSQHLVRARQIR